ncbi:MAG: trimeric autotransporter adhesin, partial [Acidobacteriota bacterium]|nr:trimeric autotransporter adhesin [Acidobacteriota bacterium]
MMAKSRVHLSYVLLCILALATFFTGGAHAQIMKQGNDTLTSLQFRSERLQPSEQVEPLEDVQSAVAQATQSAWSTFRLSAPVEWRAAVDKRHGLVAFAEGGGIAWIPGKGNSLTIDKLGVSLKPGGKKIDLAAMETIARGFLPKVAGMLGVDPKSLVLNLARSGQPASHVWFVDFDVVQGGLLVEGARVVFRVNNGNLIQFGTENLPALGSAVPAVKVTSAQALAAVAKYIGGFSSSDTFRDNGSLHLLPTNIPSTRSADGFDFGAGRGLTKVYQFVFHRDGAKGTWQARVDASTGEVLDLVDINEYATAAVTGGTYLNSPTTGSEVVRPAPYADLSIGGNANAAGLYNFTSGTVTSTLNGPFVKITDTCGAISQASDASGNIAFGTSTGTDCTTPGHGGAGNTHASREQYYQVNRIKDVVKGWLPANTWLGTKLTVNVNLNQTCNAYWNGTTLNFFKSGGGCANTGEIAGVSLHEFGHGIDQNDGTGTAPDGATGESYGDTTAIIALHSSCLGAGFLSSNCAGYGDACTSCTGVRDADFAKHASGVAATPLNFTKVHCPAASGGAGPCGKEVHCESYPITETIWDFANRDLPNPGTGPAWTTLDRLWYLSRNTATSAFTCNTSTFASSGCNTGSLWKTMRAVDDDDGNLSNGTPHGGALFAAFNRHGIACTTDAGASTTFSGCTPPASPTLSITAGSNSASLSWTASGAAVYDVFRNEQGCNAGFTKIVSGGSATSLADSNVANGLTYFYQVSAFPSGNEACASAPSACVQVTPTAGGGGTPAFTLSAAPTAVSIAAGSAGSSTLSTTVSGGFNSAIALSASGQPAGVTVSFSPTSIAAPGAGSSTMTINVAAGTAAGTSTITVTGTGGGITHTATVTVTVTTGGGTTQLLGNPGFENGSANPAPWTATAAVIDNSTGEAAHSGAWKAWMDGYGTTHTDSILQTVTIPASATTATLAFWLHIDTAETTTTTAFDTLKVQIRNTAGTVLQTLATFSNLNAATGFSQKS